MYIIKRKLHFIAILLLLMAVIPLAARALSDESILRDALARYKEKNPQQPINYQDILPYYQRAVQSVAPLLDTQDTVMCRSAEENGWKRELNISKVQGATREKSGYHFEFGWDAIFLDYGPEDSIRLDILFEDLYKPAPKIPSAELTDEEYDAIQNAMLEKCGSNQYFRVEHFETFSMGGSRHRQDILIQMEQRRSNPWSDESLTPVKVSIYFDADDLSDYNLSAKIYIDKKLFSDIELEERGSDTIDIPANMIESESKIKVIASVKSGNKQKTFSTTATYGCNMEPSMVLPRDCAIFLFEDGWRPIYREVYGWDVFSLTFYKDEAEYFGGYFDIS